MLSLQQLLKDARTEPEAINVLRAVIRRADRRKMLVLSCMKGSSSKDES